MKKIISAVLSLCIVASTFYFFDGADFKSVRADDTNVYTDENGNQYTSESDHDNGLSFLIYSDHVEVYAFVQESDKDVIIPREYKGLKVTTLDGVFGGKSVSVFLPDTLTVLNGEKVLTSDSIVKITVDKNNPVFCDDNGILFNKDKTELICYPAGMNDKEYTMPKSVQKISSTAFQMNNSIAEFKVESDNNYFSVKDGVLFDKNQTTLVRYPSAKSGMNYTVPDSVSAIYDSAFYGHIDLADIVIPDTVNKIGKEAFAECKNLSSLNIPASVTNLSERIFKGCSALKSVKLPENLERIEEYAFYDCSGLINITIPDNVNYIGPSAFYSCENLTSVNIPETVTVLNERVFSCCGFDSVTIPSSVTKISENVFDGCKKLESIDIPENVTELGMSSFLNCNELKIISIHNPNCIISDNEITKRVTQQQSSDNKKAPSMSQLVSYDGIIYGHVGSTAQKHSEKYGYHFSSFDGSVDIESTAVPIVSPSPSSDTVYKDENGNEYILSKDEESGFTYNVYADHAEIRYVQEAAGKTVVIPSEYKGVKVTAIIGSMSYDIDSIFIPDTITNISEGFLDTSYYQKLIVDENNPAYSDENGILFNKDKTELICIPYGIREKQYNIPESVQKISPRALKYCYEVFSYSVDENNKYFSSIDGVLFDKQQTTLIRYPALKEGKEYIIPDTVSKISDYAFYGNNRIEKLSIPDSVNAIGTGAFYCAFELLSLKIPESVTEISDDMCNCCPSLASVDLPESLQRIGNGAFSNCDELTTINIPDNVNYIGNGAFDICDKLSSVKMPESLQIISSGLFGGCKNLESIIIPNSVTEVRSSAFYDCEKLKTIVLPKSVSKLGLSVFDRCNALESITILNSECEMPTVEIKKARVIDNQNQDGSSTGSTTTEYYKFDGIICGYTGSTAHRFARNNGYQFSALDSETAEPTETPAATPTVVPTETPVATPTSVPTETPAATSTAVPTETPSPTPTAVPTETPATTPIAVPTETPSADIPEGDTNEDEVVNTRDFITIIKMIIGQSEKSANADLNKDGNVDASDLMLLKKILAK